MFLLGVGGGPQLNRFELVSSGDHLMSVAGGRGGPRGVGFLYSEVQGIMGNGQMVTPPVDRQNDRHIRLKTLPSRNFVGRR